MTARLSQADRAGPARSALRQTCNQYETRDCQICALSLDSGTATKNLFASFAEVCLLKVCVAASLQTSPRMCHQAKSSENRAHPHMMTIFFNRGLQSLHRCPGGSDPVCGKLHEEATFCDASSAPFRRCASRVLRACGQRPIRCTCSTHTLAVTQCYIIVW